MAGRRRIPLSRVCVFPNRTLLKENFAALIEDEDVNRPMPQVIHMHPSARFSTYDAVLSIHHTKNFLAMLSLCGLQKLSKPLPFPEREFIRPDRFS